jgi:hypothetical protein
MASTVLFLLNSYGVMPAHAPKRYPDCVSDGRGGASAADAQHRADA